MDKFVNGAITIGSLVIALMAFTGQILVPWILGFCAAAIVVYLIMKTSPVQNSGQASSDSINSALYFLAFALVCGAAFLFWKSLAETNQILIAVWAHASGFCLSGSVGPVWIARKFAK
jgi:hypothetical protein